jgi:hypothetical protein
MTPTERIWRELPSVRVTSWSTVMSRCPAGR